MPDYRDYISAMLHTFRNPSRAMATAGDPAIWERMVLVALDEAKPLTAD